MQAMQAVTVKLTPVHGPFKMSDIEDDYHPTFGNTLLPEFIQQLGGDMSPWAPTFGEVRLVQELRDELFPNIEDIVDMKSPMFGIVSTS